MENYIISLQAAGSGFGGILTSENEFKSGYDARIFTSAATAIEVAKDHVTDIIENSYFIGGKRKIAVRTFDFETDSDLILWEREF